MSRHCNYHFIFRDKSSGTKKMGHTFYLYRGSSFKDRNGYELIMMARHFPELSEVRLYSVNNITSDTGKGGMMSSHQSIKKTNSMRVEKLGKEPFDWDTDCARLFIQNNKSPNKNFILKSRYCLRCSHSKESFCTQKWEYQ